VHSFAINCLSASRRGKSRRDVYGFFGGGAGGGGGFRWGAGAVVIPRPS
jgi:hypothetical protein